MRKYRAGIWWGIFWNTKNIYISEFSKIHHSFSHGCRELAITLHLRISVEKLYEYLSTVPPALLETMVRTSFSCVMSWPLSEENRKFINDASHTTLEALLSFSFLSLLFFPPKIKKIVYHLQLLNVSPMLGTFFLMFKEEVNEGTWILTNET